MISPTSLLCPFSDYVRWKLHISASHFLVSLDNNWLQSSCDIMLVGTCLLKKSDLRWVQPVNVKTGLWMSNYVHASFCRVKLKQPYFWVEGDFVLYLHALFFFLVLVLNITVLSWLEKSFFFPLLKGESWWLRLLKVTVKTSHCDGFSLFVL